MYFTFCPFAALRGAAQIIDLAVETLKKELPPPPPSVTELRQMESKAKQEGTAQICIRAYVRVLFTKRICKRIKILHYDMFMLMICCQTAQLLP